MKRWVRNIINWALRDESGGVHGVQLGKENDVPDLRLRGDETLNFRIFNAVGGKVVEFVQYNLKTSQQTVTNYVVTDDQDLGERISKIITLERLKG